MWKFRVVLGLNEQFLVIYTFNLLFNKVILFCQ